MTRPAVPAGLLSVMRADVEFPYNSGLPRDVAINSFYWASTDTGLSGAMSDMGARISTFYNGLADGQTAELCQYMGECLDRAHVHVKFYDLSQPDGTPPADQATVTLGAAASDEFPLPLQVSLCASYRSNLNVLGGSTLQPLQRRSGRIYLGPLNTAAISKSTTANYPTPTTQFINDVQAAATHFASNNARTGGWCVYSPKSNLYSVIDEGWVDNEWDIQRRRRVDASTRNAWSVSF